MPLYFELAIKVVKHLKLPCDALNLDSSSIHVDGRYNSDSEVDDEDLNCIRLCKGYSCDNRSVTLCLMAYAAIQHGIRYGLKKQPNVSGHEEETRPEPNRQMVFLPVLMGFMFESLTVRRNTW